MKEFGNCMNLARLNESLTQIEEVINVCRLAMLQVDEYESKSISHVLFDHAQMPLNEIIEEIKARTET